MSALRSLALVVAVLPVLLFEVAVADDLNVSLQKQGGQVVAKASPAKPRNGTNGATVIVTCSAQVDCATAAPTASASWQSAQEVKLAPDPANPKRFIGKVDPGAGDLTVQLGGTSLGAIPVAAANGATLPPPVTDGGARTEVSQGAVQVSLHELLPVPASCLNKALTQLGPLAPYDAASKTVHVAITPLGALLSQPPEVPINEGDTLALDVVGNAELLPFLTVRRASALRSLAAVNIVGGDVKFTLADREQLQAAGGPEAKRCATRRFFVRDFAPGRGEVQIIAVPADGTELTIGRMEFPVSALYSGMFSLGAIWSDVQDPSFSVVSNGSASVVTSSERGSRRLLYTLMYTPFIWGKRDLQRPERWDALETWWHHLNPTVGVVLEDVPANAVAGVSFDFGEAFVLTYGVHVAHVREIDPESGLAIGATFAGATVPTVKRWKTGQFFGVSIDLRAAVQLLRSVAR